MAEPRTTLTDIVAESTTCRITGALVDETGAALGSSSLTTLTLTLYALTDKLPIINAVDGVNILDTGRGAIDAGGNLTLTLTPADGAIQATGSPSEIHRALLKWTWLAGAKAGAHEIDFRVRNLDK